MKTALVIILSAIATFASGATNDVLAIAAATSATEIRTCSTGYRITTPEGTRIARRNATGYYVEGTRRIPSQQIIRTSTGYRVESNASRGAAFSNRR